MGACHSGNLKQWVGQVCSVTRTVCVLEVIHMALYGCGQGTYGLAGDAFMPPFGHLCPPLIALPFLPGTHPLWPHSWPLRQLADFWWQPSRDWRALASLLPSVSAHRRLALTSRDWQTLPCLKDSHMPACRHS